MGVKTGYKQTEVGVIPEDWGVKILGDLFTFSGGVSASRDQLSNNGHCYLHYGDIHTSNKTYIDAINEAIDIPRLDIDIRKVPTRSLLFDGDIVFVDASEDDDGASKHIVVRNTDNRKFISGLHTIVVKSKGNTFNNLYKEYCFQTCNIKQWFRYYAVGTKVTGISKTNIVKIPIPIPPLSEQNAIATALSDADALIQSLERLIAKKRDIKQGAMKELLTGKKRLPGFEKKKGYKQTEVGVIPEDWEIRPLEYAVEFLDMQRRPIKSSDRIKMAGIYPYYGASGIIDYVNGYLFDEALILLGEDGENILSRTMRLAFRVSGKIWVNNHAHVLRPKLGIDIVYITEYLESRDYKEYNSGTAQPKLNRQTCSRIPVALPHIAEQSAIATVLSDMDAEIAALDSKLAKARQIKQGMMQELLTGRIRLV